MEVLFVGCVYSDTKKIIYQRASRRGFQAAAQNLQEALIEGFIQNGIHIRVLSIPALSTFPMGCRKMVVSGHDYVYNGTKLGRCFGFLNLPFMNKSDSHKTSRYVDDWYNGTSSDKHIFVYAMLAQQMAIAVAAKRRHPDIRIHLIVPDLPLYMNCNKYYRILGLQESNMASIHQLVNEFDSYVVLAKPMIEALNISDKPFVVVEGISYSADDETTGYVKFPEKTIMYAGGIQSRYGVFDLIEAFHRISAEDYRFILCGGCGEKEELEQCLSRDHRIEYLGLIPTSKVREIQKQVTLLVNPRHSSEEFTKYSFPSKTLEYMASGTPVLMSPLPSMPDEYKEHLYLFEDESVEGMRKAIENILLKNEVELVGKGAGAKEFILSQKNPKVQVAKIIDLIQ